MTLFMLSLSIILLEDHVLVVVVLINDQIIVVAERVDIALGFHPFAK